MALRCLVGQNAFSGRGAVWLARLTGGQEVAGSSPVAPSANSTDSSPRSAGNFDAPVGRCGRAIYQRFKHMIVAPSAKSHNSSPRSAGSFDAPVGRCRLSPTTVLAAAGIDSPIAILVVYPKWELLMEGCRLCERKMPRSGHLGGWR